jgi:hypothetical protein
MPKDLAKTISLEHYLAFQRDQTGLAEILQANLGGRQISGFDLDRAKVPTGGGLSWDVPGESEAVKSVTGVILHWGAPRAYWVQDLQDGPPSAPDCSSDDGIAGQGNPGGECATCPFNQWSSGKNNGKACKEKRLLFLLPPDSLLPLVVQVPTMSIKSVEHYLLRLASQRLHYSAVETSLTLIRKMQAKGGLPYSQILATKTGELGPVDLAKLKEFGNILRPIMAKAAAQTVADEPLE